MNKRTSTRRDFLSIAGASAASLILSSCGLEKEQDSHQPKAGNREKPKHIITLSFDDGWGPITSGFLDKLLERLTAVKSVAVMPAGKALSQFGTV